MNTGLLTRGLGAGSPSALILSINRLYVPSYGGGGGGSQIFGSAWDIYKPVGQPHHAPQYLPYTKKVKFAQKVKFKLAYGEEWTTSFEEFVQQFDVAVKASARTNISVATKSVVVNLIDVDATLKEK